MKIGDLVKWTWFLEDSWDPTGFQGVIVAVRPVFCARAGSVLVFDVLDNLGEISDVREDAPGMELVA